MASGGPSVFSQVLIVVLLVLYFFGIGIGTPRAMTAFAKSRDMNLQETSFKGRMSNLGTFLRPGIPILCVMVIQQPLVGLSLSYLFDLGVHDSIGIFFICLSPSSGLANFLCLYINGDVLLGMLVTVATLVCSFLVYPFGLVALTAMRGVELSRVRSGDSLDPPYESIFTTLGYLSGSFLLAVFIAVKVGNEKAVEIGGYMKKFTLVSIIVLLASLIYDLRELLASMSVEYYLIPFCLSFCAVLATSLFHLVVHRFDMNLVKKMGFTSELRAMFMHSSVQNVGIAYGIIASGFDSDNAGLIMRLPLTYIFTGMIWGLACVRFFVWYDARIDVITNDKQDKQDVILDTMMTPGGDHDTQITKDPVTVAEHDVVIHV